MTVELFAGAAELRFVQAAWRATIAWVSREQCSRRPSRRPSDTYAKNYKTGAYVSSGRKVSR